MIREILLRIVFISFLCQICCEKSDIQYQEYANILDVSGIPKQSEDRSCYCFSDQGSWIGFGLPDKEDTVYRGGFTGPLRNANRSYKDIAVKSLLTLVTNWRSQADDLHFDGLFPSYVPGYFNGVWARDFWKHAERVMQMMTDTSKFDLYVPLPTVSADNPAFMDGYWRGPVWLDQAYFGIKGLELYGFSNQADKLRKDIINRLQGLKDSPLPMYENYDPVNGKGLNAAHFSWSAVHLLLMLWGGSESRQL